MLNQTPPCDLRGGVMGSFFRIFFFCIYFGLGTKSFVFQAFPLLWTFPHILIPQIHSAIYLQEFADICESLYDAIIIIPFTEMMMIILSLESLALNRSITIAASSCRVVIFPRRCMSGYGVGFRGCLWVWCSYGVNFQLKHKSSAGINATEI